MFQSLRCVLVLLVCVAGCTSSDQVVEESLPAAEPTIEATLEAATPEPEPPAASTAPPTEAPPKPGVNAYRGLGAWIDVFDWAPAYAGTSGPSVTPDDLTNMANLGVTTLYMQTSRLDDVGSGRIESPEVVRDFLAVAADLEIAVIGWYLPRWDDGAEDLARLVAIDEFEMDGLRFDGIAVDIEGVPEPAQRADWNVRLVELSRDLSDAVGPRALGAIVLPPTLIEVVNTDYWPDFPWAEIAPFYDVWLPMSYWSFRADDSPFANGYSYNTDATARLRSNLADPSAIVHAIGGIGALAPNEDAAEAGNTSDASGASGSEPRATVGELDDFVRSLVDTGAVGGSIYDWASMDPSSRAAMNSAMDEAGLTAD